MKMTLDFDRWDYLATRLLLVGTLLAIAGVALVAPLIGWTTHGDLTYAVRTTTGAAVADPTPLPGVEATWDSTALVTIADASAPTWLALVMQGLMLTVAAGLVIGPLLLLVRSIQQGRSFTGRSVTWLRIAALTVVIAPWVHQAVSGCTNAVVLRAAFGGDTFSANFVISTSMLAISGAGLVLAALAEALRRGREIEADVEGLV